MFYHATGREKAPDFSGAIPLAVPQGAGDLADVVNVLREVTFHATLPQPTLRQTDVAGPLFGLRETIRGEPLRSAATFGASGEVQAASGHSELLDEVNQQWTRV
jgi:hypothetical protein